MYQKSTTKDATRERLLPISLAAASCNRREQSTFATKQKNNKSKQKMSPLTSSNKISHSNILIAVSLNPITIQIGKRRLY